MFAPRPLRRSCALLLLASIASVAFVRSARADEAPRVVPRFDFGLGGAGLLDSGALDHALTAAHRRPLPGVGFAYSGAFSLEAARFQLSVEVSDGTWNQGTTQFSRLEGALDLGLRVLGRPLSWGVVPYVGVGGSRSTLGLGAPSTAASFAAALGEISRQELEASCLVLRTGLRVDVFAYRAPRSTRGVSLGLAAGLEAAPAASGFRVVGASGLPDGQELAGAPRVPSATASVLVRLAASF